MLFFIIPLIELSVTLFNEYTESVFEQINHQVADLTPEELTWKPCETSNTVEWILKHITRINRLLIPKALSGDTEGGWSDDYQAKDHSYEEMIKDMKDGQDIIRGLLREMSDENLGEEIRLWNRTEKKYAVYFHLMHELVHHGGQIAYIRGALKRSKER